jgi:TPR repeat protein
MVHGEYATSENCTSDGLKLLRNLAEKSDMEAQLELAGLLNSDISKIVKDLARPQPDDAEAFRWYMAVATAHPDNTTAAIWLARFYDEGLSISKNLERAFHWYLVAATLGDRQGIREAARMLAKGEGTTKNVTEAINLLGKLRDDEGAQLQLAAVYIFYDADGGSI